jgi:outer membrane lipoprotein-sorting protein
MVRLTKLLAILVLSVSTIALDASAQNAPEKKQQPKAQTQQPQQQPKGPTAAVTKSGIELDQRQVSALERVTKFFNATATLVGKFHQIGPDGSKTEGTFYMQRPGRVRFEYEEPSPIELIADGSSVAVRNRTLATQDIYPLSQTPLRFLLAEKIDLLRDSNIIAVLQDELFITVVMEEKSAVAGTHRLRMLFGAKDNQLKQWTITDPQGFDTTVSVYDLDSKTRPNPALFKIDFTRYQQ